MKALIAITIVTLFLVPASAPACGPPGGHHGARGHGFGPGHGPGGDPASALLGRLGDSLGLSDEQRGQISAMVEAASVATA